jgi:hypothetical protein
MSWIGQNNKLEARGQILVSKKKFFMTQNIISQ